MPMNWNAKAYSKLFAATIKIHDIKPDYAALAAEMGEGCTAKAVSHQFARLRSLGKDGSPSTASPARSGTGTPGRKRAATTSTPRKAAAKQPKPTVHKDEGEDDDEGDDGKDYEKLDDSDEQVNNVVSPSVDRSKLRRSASTSAKRVYREDSDSEDDDGPKVTAKRVKREDSMAAQGTLASNGMSDLPDFNDDMPV